MKKIKTYFSIFILITTIHFSCSNDDDNVNNGQIIGTWNGISSTYNGQNAGIPDNTIVIFSSNNRVEFIYEGFGNNGEDISELGSWTLNGNNLRIEWDDSDPGLEIYNLQIIELSNSTLKWSTIIDGGTLIETFNK
jgi:hypothetical protein